MVTSLESESGTSLYIFLVSYWQFSNYLIDHLRFVLILKRRIRAFKKALELFCQIIRTKVMPCYVAQKKSVNFHIFHKKSSVTTLRVKGTSLNYLSC